MTIERKSNEVTNRSKKEISSKLGLHGQIWE